MEQRKLVLYIAMSVDGYIADVQDGLSFLHAVEKAGEDYGYNQFVSTVDTVIMGRKTYDSVLAMGYDYPHPEKDSYIITRTARPANGNVKFYTGDINELVNRLKAQPGKNIYCDGGAEIANLLMQGGHIDEFVISVIPVLLGGGVSLFRNGRPQAKLQLQGSVSYDTGLVQLHYKVIR